MVSDGGRAKNPSSEESRRNFESLFFGNPEAAVYLDESLHIVEENPRFIDLFGYSLGETRGRHIDDIVVPNSLIGS